MKRHCIVNVAVGEGHVRGQERLRASLTYWYYQGDFLAWTDTYPPGSPTHQQTPYAFKFYAIQEALKRGYDTVLWLDASFWFVAEPMKIMNVIDERGYALWLCGFAVGQWTKDGALAPMRIGREESFEIPLVMGGAIGISANSCAAMRFQNRLLAYAGDGITFPGPWSNKNGEASADSRVLGHRHDQPPISVEAQRLLMEPFGCPYLIAYWSPEINPETVAVCKGHT